MAIRTDFHHDPVRTCLRIADFHYISVHIISIVQDIIDGRRIESGALKLYHIVLTARKGSEPV